jgi:hypothetical protein
MVITGYCQSVAKAYLKDGHPRGPRRSRGSNSDVRIAARFGRPIKTTPSPSPTTVEAGGLVNTSPLPRWIWTMKKAPFDCLWMAPTVMAPVRPRLAADAAAEAFWRNFYRGVPFALRQGARAMLSQ